jgi:hypothetical protein
MTTAIILLALAAVGGGVLAAIRISGQPYPPLWLSLGHGAIAASGLVALIYAALTMTLPSLALVALGMFVLTALGGATLLGLFHLQGRPLPILLVLGHGGLAIASLVVLLIAAYS